MTRKIAMNSIRAVVSRLSLGLNYSVIQREVHVSKGLISKIAQAVKSSNLTPDAFLQLSDHEIHAKLYPPTKHSRQEPDWSEINEQLKIKHSTLQLAYEHYYQNHSGVNLPYSYSSFCRICQQWRQSQLPFEPYVNLDLDPGEKIEIDFAGDPLTWTDQFSQIHHARLFLAALPYSGMIFAQVFENEKQAAWMQGIVEALAYFGGAAKNLVLDNAKALVNDLRLISKPTNQLCQCRHQTK